jgi:hypothetical protein
VIGLAGSRGSWHGSGDRTFGSFCDRRRIITEGQIFFLLLVVIAALLIVGLVGCARRSPDDARQYRRWRRKGFSPRR